MTTRLMSLLMGNQITCASCTEMRATTEKTVLASISARADVLTRWWWMGATHDTGPTAPR